MDKQQIIHDISIAYVLYHNLCDKPISPEDFYQEYQNVTMQFEKIAEKN